MSIVTIIWSMTASACLTLALIHLLIWSRQRSSLVNLLFSSAAISTAAIAALELMMMTRVETSHGAAILLRWGQIPVWIILISLCGFTRLYFRAGRMWLFWTILILRSLSLILNFVIGDNLNYLHVTGVRHHRFLGQTVSIPTGVPNPAMIVGQASLILLIFFVVDAAWVAWKRGQRRQAVIVGGGIAFFLLASLVTTGLHFWFNFNLPIVLSLFYLGFLIAMGYELSIDVSEATRLSRELRASEKRIMAAAQAATLGEISVALAHELNQPLSAILSNAQAAQRFLATDNFDLAEIREILTDIVSDNHRATDVIQKMRTLLKKGVLNPQPLDANELIREVLHLLANELSARAITVHTNLANALPNIYGDRVQFQQVLINLFRNAADAMSENTDALHLLTLSSRMHGQTVQICVADNGPGISPGQEERIFRPNHTTKPTGLGLGLSLSRTIAAAYGGQLVAENLPGGGANFCFNVPAVKEETNERRNPDTDRVPGG